MNLHSMKMEKRRMEDSCRFHRWVRPNLTLLLQIVAACSLAKGEEIFNTFGELENTELVCKYGFALPNNPFNSVHLNKEVLLQQTEALIGSKQLKRRQQYLEEKRYGYRS